MLTHSASASSGVHVASDADSGTGTPEHRSPVALFVSTALGSWTTDHPKVFARDVQINDTAYRRLDPEYYAWLRSRMVFAKEAATTGRLSLAAFENLRVRFNSVHEWAVHHFGEALLLALVRTFHSGDYKPPVAEDDDPHVPAPCERKAAVYDISAEAMALVHSTSVRLKVE